MSGQTLKRALASIAALTGAAGAAEAGETIAYSYDARGRLVGVARGGTINHGVATSYVHDKADNRISMAEGIGTPPPAPPPPAFAVTNAAVAEGGMLAFTVTKSASTGSTHSVSYTTAAGTAAAGTDFTTTAGTLTFAASQASQIVNVPTVEDAAVEADETLSLTLSAPTGGATLADAQATGTIENDDVIAPPANAPPTTVADSLSVARCATGSRNVVANDSDPEGNLPLVLLAVTSGSNGNASVSSSTTVTYESYDVSGSDVLTYTVRDSLGAQSTGTLTVTISSGGTCQ